MIAKADPKYLEKFDAAMLDIYERAKSETGYNATRFLQMIRQKGGYQTAVELLSGRVTDVSDGFTHLALKQRLDLSVEGLVLRDEWQPLFDAKLIKNARLRLK